MNRPNVILQCQGLRKRFSEGRLDVTVLQGIDLEVCRGETLAIVGTSGKSGERRVPSTASARSLPAWICGRHCTRLSKLKST